MDIKLKNSKTISLEIGPIFLEYLDDYEGGLETIINDWSNQKNQIYIINYFIYAAIASNYDSPITYRESLRLVDFNDYNKIADFIASNIPKLTEVNPTNLKEKHF